MFMNPFTVALSWKRLIRHLALAMATLGVTPLVVAQDRFIDGFPDVPYMDTISHIEGSPMVFDTAGGTVAEATIVFSVGADKVMRDYQIALDGLSWECTSTATVLECERDANIVTFTALEARPESARFILRLEPKQ